MLFDSEKKAKKHFMVYASSVALPAFLDGNLYYARILQDVFALDNAEHYQIKIANAYEQLLSKSSLKNLIDIEESCRHWLWLYRNDIPRLWSPDWKTIDMSRGRFPHLSDTQYISVLKLGTFHADGYCRERCLEKLSIYPDTLLFFIRRMNDWVEPIRELAFNLACKRLEVCDTYELSNAIPILERLQISHRRKTEYLYKIEQLFTEKIKEKISTLQLNKIHTYEISVKNSIYRLVNRSPLLPLEAMEMLFQHEKQSYGKRMIIRGILYQYDCNFETIQKYLHDKSSVVRYEALVYWYHIKKNTPEDDLTNLLMDQSKRIRLEVSYILEKYNVLNVLDYYKNQLAENVSVVAICGIGEHGKSNDIELIKPYFESQDDRLVRAALMAYICLTGENDEEIYWKYLLDNRVVIRKLAYVAIKKYHIYYNVETLYNEYQKREDETLKKYLLHLICTHRSTWGRLPYLLRLLGSTDNSKELENKLMAAIRNRSMYAHVSQNEAQQIKDILEELSPHCQPVSNFKKSIEYDLKFVTR